MARGIWILVAFLEMSWGINSSMGGTKKNYVDCADFLSLRARVDNQEVTIRDLKAQIEALRRGVEETPGFKTVWTDPRGIRWSGIARGPDGQVLLLNQRKAEEYCNERGWRLPSGYPENFNGRYGFPNEDSDFVAAWKAGIGEKLDMGYWFWSSSVHPHDSSFAFVFNGRVGGIDFDSRGSNVDAVRCVSRASVEK